MIQVDRALCVGCGICADECATGALALVAGEAVFDPALCDGCQDCITVCPNGALAWVTEPVPDSVALAPVEPRVEVISVEPKELTPWRRTVLPAVGGALAWIGRELVPRLAPLALDVLDNALDHRSGDTNVVTSLADPGGRPRRRGRSKQKRRRHRGRRS